MKTIYAVIATETSDDYKRAHGSSEVKLARTYEDAVAIAAHMYLERVQDRDMFFSSEDLHTEFKKAVANTNATEIADKVYDFFQAKQYDIFVGDFVPFTFEVNIQERILTKVPSKTLMTMVKDLATVEFD